MIQDIASAKARAESFFSKPVEVTTRSLQEASDAALRERTDRLRQARLAREAAEAASRPARPSRPARRRA